MAGFSVRMKNNDVVEPLSDVELVYGYLINHHHNAARKQDEALRERIFKAIEVYEELWPDETARWRAIFETKDRKR